MQSDTSSDPDGAEEQWDDMAIVRAFEEALIDQRARSSNGAGRSHLKNDESWGSTRRSARKQNRHAFSVNTDDGKSGSGAEGGSSAGLSSQASYQYSMGHDQSSATPGYQVDSGSVMTQASPSMNVDPMFDLQQQQQQQQQQPLSQQQQQQQQQPLSQQQQQQLPAQSDAYQAAYAQAYVDIMAQVQAANDSQTATQSYPGYDQTQQPSSAAYPSAQESPSRGFTGTPLNAFPASVPSNGASVATPPSFPAIPRGFPAAPYQMPGLGTDDGLANLLLAWYQSGYYTGRFQAMQEMKARSRQ